MQPGAHLKMMRVATECGYALKELADVDVFSLLLVCAFGFPPPPSYSVVKLADVHRQQNSVLDADSPLSLVMLPTVAEL